MKRRMITAVTATAAEAIAWPPFRESFVWSMTLAVCAYE